jgi:putative spermidine/putrescine transport system ATP-binding protein
MSTLSLIDLSKRFGSDVNAVNNVNLHVEDGEFLCILGPSGCGKSTALRMIAGFEEPTSGDVQIDGQSVVNMDANKRPTAMVFQKYTLWPHMKVYDNIAFGLRLRKMSRGDIDRKVRESLELVGLGTYGPRLPSQLSGGEQQRVALARALVLEPKILLLDEPFSNLDALLRVRLREELRRIQRRVKITAIFVTHDQEEALSLADRIAVMNKGRVEQLDHPSAIYANPQTLFVADFIGVMNLLPATAQANVIHFSGRRLYLPAGQHLKGNVTIAIRPEDLVQVNQNSPEAWVGTAEQVIDLGHYRKALVRIPEIGVVKVYLSKAVEVYEADTLSLYPSRFTVYQDNQPPVEVKQPLNSDVSLASVVGQ